MYTSHYVTVVHCAFILEDPREFLSTYKCKAFPVTFLMFLTPMRGEKIARLMIQA